MMPLFLLVALILKINKITPVIFIQKRSGKNNKTFNIYKFRTLDSKRNSKFCLFLRKTGIDELPQLFNILFGEMSFIGPRPWILKYSEYFNDEQKVRLNVSPGLTGLAQINICNSVFEKIYYDIYYVKNISFILDLKIFIKTFLLIFTNSKKEITTLGIEQEINDLKNQT
jgi:undecaprenyl phosphate N,N'-diacetylbacillosamine 1-phosphate transferase